MRRHCIYLICNPSGIAIYSTRNRNEAFDYFRRNCNPTKDYIRECYS